MSHGACQSHVVEFLRVPGAWALTDAVFLAVFLSLLKGTLTTVTQGGVHRYITSFHWGNTVPHTQGALADQRRCQPAAVLVISTGRLPKCRRACEKCVGSERNPLAASLKGPAQLQTHVGKSAIGPSCDSREPFPLPFLTVAPHPGWLWAPSGWLRRGAVRPLPPAPAASG